MVLSFFLYTSCKAPSLVPPMKMVPVPSSYQGSNDSTNSAQIKWRDFFADKNLVALIDTALKNNPEILATLQEIEIAKSNVMFRKGMLLPQVSVGGGYSLEKVGRYTSQGAGDASAEITPGRIVPENLSDFAMGFKTSWEVDIWGKLHNYKKAALLRYLSTVEGRNFVLTNLVAEVANSYYELLALDNQLEIVRASIKLQQDALEIVKFQKEASRATELGVKQFEAQVLNSQSMEFEILQQISINENKINFLLGRFPQPIIRDKAALNTFLPATVNTGIPSQLLRNRTDIKQAELELFATQCNVKAARAEFYPSLSIDGAMGFQAFKAVYLLTTPQSLMYALAGELTAPLINRSAIKAEFNKAKAEQIKAMYDYQKAILNGYVEVSNEMSNIRNLNQLYNLKSKEVDTRIKAIEISNDLFKTGRADYFEVLMAQRDVLDAKLELVEARKRQMNAVTNLYKALGGGWQ